MIHQHKHITKILKIIIIIIKKTTKNTTKKNTTNINIINTNKTINTKLTKNKIHTTTITITTKLNLYINIINHNPLFILLLNNINTTTKTTINKNQNLLTNTQIKNIKIKNHLKNHLKKINQHSNTNNTPFTITIISQINHNQLLTL